MQKQQTITPAHLEQAMDYTQYVTFTEQLLSENKTTGTNHSADLVEYTRMNLHRMRRGEKSCVLTSELLDTLQSIDREMVWVVITEAWCGDAAQNLPGIVKIAEASPLIDVKFLMRDEHLDVMDAYLTNGGRSIPKLIALDAETLEELGTWGPRPEPAQQLVLDAKAQKMDFKEMAEKLHGWYGKDRSRTLQQEFVPLIREWANVDETITESI
ncbi:thioredoxin family protein [Pontibacter sp. KCTC 32443]|uniref:thioredoxin family protein n=1 Tax=Pontibacter TaxID=323449 RepID=UPI00164D4F39|nr:MULTISPECIES: thioredoxin family protein [Pontibacter]MBC5775482.1 thioredoxin family protein [Pontibacter sp. KCTC 32443]